MLKTFSGRNASQDEWELTSFRDLLVANGVRRYLEIGARHGDTAHFLVSSLPAGSYAVLVDLPGGLWGKKSSVESLLSAQEDLTRRGYFIDTLLRDSTSRYVVDSVKAAGPFDAILIDGDHLYEGVKKDWENFGRLAPIVAFHDIVGHDQREKVHGNPVEVPRLWAELKATHDHTEFISSGSKMGIGVIRR